MVDGGGHGGVYVSVCVCVCVCVGGGGGGVLYLSPASTLYIMHESVLWDTPPLGHPSSVYFMCPSDA